MHRIPHLFKADMNSYMQREIAAIFVFYRNFYLKQDIGWVYEMDGFARASRKANTKRKILADSGVRTRYFRLRSRRPINCTTRSDVHNRLKVNQVLHVPVLFTSYTTCQM